jgi:hypothetical protein
MLLIRSLLFLILMTAAAEVAQAQIVLPSDVGVTLTASPTTNLQPGQPIDMTLTVTNYGPAAVPILVLSSSIFVDEMYVASTNPDECYLLLDVIDLSNGTAEYELDWTVAGLGGVLPPMPAGLTLTCHFQIALTRSAPSTYNFSFGLPPTYETDPNPSNDRATVTLQRTPAARPTSLPALSTMMLCLLAGLNAAFAVRALRHPQRAQVKVSKPANAADIG